ncbi:MAG: hypothetical protein ACW99Q_15780 [Candidatus Kariarchaeaceae archaeon]|jgi:hypothetical protein
MNNEEDLMFPYTFSVKINFFTSIESKDEQDKIIPEIINFLMGKYPMQFNLTAEIIRE